MPRVTVQEEVTLPSGIKVTVKFAGDLLSQAQRLQSDVVAHPKFVAAITNIMDGNYIKAHGIRAYGNIGEMDTYIHMPDSNNGELMGFSHVDRTNHFVTIECTGHVRNNRHEFSIRGDF